jgi:hypothetical protein
MIDIPSIPLGQDSILVRVHSGPSGSIEHKIEAPREVKYPARVALLSESEVKELIALVRSQLRTRHKKEPEKGDFKSIGDFKSVLGALPGKFGDIQAAFSAATEDGIKINMLTDLDRSLEEISKVSTVDPSSVYVAAGENSVYLVIAEHLFAGTIV